MKAHSYRIALLCCYFMCSNLNSFSQEPDTRQNSKNFDDFLNRPKVHSITSVKVQTKTSMISGNVSTKNTQTT